MNLLLIRHGATQANIEKRFQGKKDFPLCNEGKLQAKLLADRLKTRDISMIYSSNLIRAKDTANEIAKYHGDRVEVLPELVEYSWGDIEGMTREEIRLKDKELADRMDGDFWQTEIPGEEGFIEFQGRLKRVYELLVNRHLETKPPSDTVAVITHGRVLGGFLAYITGHDLYDLPWPYVFSNASLTEVKTFYYNEEYRSRILLLNDCCHNKDVKEGMSY